MQNPYLVGRRIYLRPLEREDAPRMVPWLNDPEVRRTLGRQQPINRQVEEDYIDQMRRSEHDLLLGIVVRETDRLIGGVGFHQINAVNRHACFGIVIGEPAEHGKGYGTEATALIVRHAFETLNLNRVWLQVYEFNPAAIRTYEKVGFKVEGRLRQEVFREGRYWDTIVMGILREEWDPQRVPV